MSKTTKTLLVIGAVIVLSYPGVAWLTGLAVESQLQHSEDQAMARTPYLTLVRREYHRGVYRSTEVVTYGLRRPFPHAVKMGGGATGAPEITLTVENAIQHGPLPGLRTVALATIDSTLILPPRVQQQLSAVLGSEPVLRVHTRVGLTGGSTAQITSPAFSLRETDGSTIDWQGLTGTMTTERGGAGWSGQLTAPRLAVQSPQGALELLGLGFSGSGKQAFDAFDLGNSILTVEKLDGSDARTGNDFSLQRLSLASASRADGEFFDMEFDAAADAARFGSVSLSNLVYSERLAHLHGPSFAALAQALREAQRQAAAGPARLQGGISDAFRHYGPELLRHDPVLEIRQIGFTMPEGSFLLSAKVRAPGLSTADLQWPAVLPELRSHAEVTADLRIDNGLLQKLLSLPGSGARYAAQLTALEQQGYLSAGPATVTTHVEFSGGRLTLNGRPFPPMPAP